MLSQTAEYALRAMTQLAIDAPNSSITLDVAKRTQVPGTYLTKVFQTLNHAGLVTTRRGIGGGVKLARPPKRISLLEIVNAVEPLIRKGNDPRGAAFAPFNRKMGALTDQLRKGLAATSLADVAPRFAKANGRPKAKA